MCQQFSRPFLGTWSQGLGDCNVLVFQSITDTAAVWMSHKSSSGSHLLGLRIEPEMKFSELGKRSLHTASGLRHSLPIFCVFTASQSRSHDSRAQTGLGLLFASTHLLFCTCFLSSSISFHTKHCHSSPNCDGYCAWSEPVPGPKPCHGQLLRVVHNNSCNWNDNFNYNDMSVHINNCNDNFNYNHMSVHIDQLQKYNSCFNVMPLRF